MDEPCGTSDHQELQVTGTVRPQVGAHSPCTQIQQALPVIFPHLIQPASTWSHGLSWERLLLAFFQEALEPRRIPDLCNAGHDQAATKTSLDAARAITRRAWQRQHVRSTETCRMWMWQRPEQRGASLFSAPARKRGTSLYELPVEAPRSDLLRWLRLLS